MEAHTADTRPLSNDVNWKEMIWRPATEYGLTASSKSLVSVIQKSWCQVCFSKKGKPSSLTTLLWTPKTKVEEMNHHKPHVSLFAKNSW